MAPPSLPKLSPLNFPSSPTTIKHVRAQWVALIIMKDGGCSLNSAKVTNPNIIKVVAKLAYITHPPN